VGEGKRSSSIHTFNPQAHPTFRSAELIDGFLERAGRSWICGRPSQTDLLAVIGLEKRIAIVAIEGKAGEPFGDWSRLAGRERD